MTCDLSGKNSHWCDGHLGPMTCGICHESFPCSTKYLRHGELGNGLHSLPIAIQVERKEAQ
jgi:hypothetical protein